MKINSLKKGQVIKGLEVIDYTFQGQGIVKYDGVAIFVKYVTLGDKIDVKITKVEKSYAYALNIKDNHDQVECKYFKECGGCQVMHLNYNQQCEFKEKHIKNLISKSKLNIQANPIVKSDEPLRYRNKVMMPFTTKDNKIKVGFFKERTHTVIPIEHCLLQTDEVTQIANYVCELMNEVGETVYQEDLKTGNLRHLYIRNGYNVENIMVCFVLNGDKLKNQKEIVKALTSKFKNINAVVINENKRRTNAVLGFRNINLYNVNTFTEIIGGKKYIVEPNAFFQVNTNQCEKLYQTLVDNLNLTQDDNVLDAYCGCGSISLFISDLVKSVTGVEISPQAINSANKNMKINSVTNTKFICKDINKEITNVGKLKYSTLIVDPPRAGLSREFINLINESTIQKLGYVSCNPDTLLRDLAILSKYYNIDSLTPVDMFSQTYHVEVVVTLTKK